MKWAVSVAVLLLVVLAVLAFAVPFGDENTPVAQGAAAADEGTGRGSRSNPIPLKTWAAIGGGWRMKIVRATPNATSQVTAASGVNRRPPPGAQDFMVFLSLRYTGGGKGYAGYIIDSALRAMGAHNASYNTLSDSCGELPEPSLQYSGYIFSGQKVRGNVCFQIAKNDAKSLKLYTAGDSIDGLGVSLPEVKRAWFALR